MAHIEIWYECPVCREYFGSLREANRCKSQHPIVEEKWAVGDSGKAVRIFDNHNPTSRHGVIGALREADISDIKEEQRRE